MRLRPLILLLPLAAVLPASAQPDARSLRTETLAGTCAACHGPQGRAPAGSAIPALAGRPAAELAAALRALAAGTREATVMARIARGYSEAQVDELAAFFAAQRP